MTIIGTCDLSEATCSPSSFPNIDGASTKVSESFGLSGRSDSRSGPSITSTCPVLLPEQIFGSFSEHFEWHTIPHAESSQISLFFCAFPSTPTQPLVCTHKHTGPLANPTSSRCTLRIA